MSQTDSREAEFYLLPKIHKNPVKPPGRPIMSGNGHPTEWISAWVDCKLQPLMKALPTYLKDSTHLLNLLGDVNITPHSRLVSLDVSSLYTNIPHSEGLEAITEVSSLLSPDNDFTDVKRLASLVLKNNIFKFDNNFYIQCQGTAMGTRMAPAYANIFMYTIESVILHGNPQITFWRRFIDDIFCVFEESPTFSADNLLSASNSVSPDIQFTMDCDREGIAFLDMLIWIKNSTIHTRPYQKPTDKKLYLRPDSCHPKHQITGIAFSQALRLKRICSHPHHLKEELQQLTSNLTKRGHNQNTTNSQILKADKIDRQILLSPNCQTRKEENSSTINFITTYYHGISRAHKIFKQLQTKHAILFDYRITYRRDRNLKDLLVRAKLPSCQEKPTIEDKLTMRDVNTSIKPKFCNKELDDRICISCHTFSLERKFILHRETLHVINRQITSCKQLHNSFVIRCLLCNTWDSHTETISPHALISNFRNQGYSTHPQEHCHLRSSADIMVYPVWSYHNTRITCNKCRFSTSVNITRMPTTIEKEIQESIRSLQLGIFHKDFEPTSCPRRTCAVCPRIETGLLITTFGNHFRTRAVKCDTPGIIYALQCLWCSKIYIGQSGRPAHIRIQEHLRNIRKA